MTPLKVLFATAEATPFAKTGGLADVSQALPRALAAARARRARRAAALPAGARAAPGPRRRRPAARRSSSRRRTVITSAGIARATFPGSTLDALLRRLPRALRPRLASTRRTPTSTCASSCSRAPRSSSPALAWAPDVVHAHDWQTALLPLYLKTVYAWDRLFARTRSLLTIHNLGYQGVFASQRRGATSALGDGAHLLHQDELRAGRVNFLQTGHPVRRRLSHGEPDLRARDPDRGVRRRPRRRSCARARAIARRHPERRRLRRVEPAHRPAHPRAATRRRACARKEQNKQALLESVGLPYATGVPVLGIVSRLVAPEGLRAARWACCPSLLAQRGRAASSCSAAASGATRRFLRDLQHAVPGQVALLAGLQRPLAHLIEAGADMFLMPSRYEPCGLNQMYSLRYGTVPIVRRTGGLADTVEPCDPRDAARAPASCSSTTPPTGLRWAIEPALDAYRDRARWRRCMQNGMAEDFAWDVGRALRELRTTRSTEPAWSRDGGDRPCTSSSSSRASPPTSASSCAASPRSARPSSASASARRSRSTTS